MTIIPIAKSISFPQNNWFSVKLPNKKYEEWKLFFIILGYLLFHLWTFSLFEYIVTWNEKADFIKKNSWIFKIFKNRILLEANIWKSIIHKPSLGFREVAHKIWAWSVQPFWVYWIQTDNQTDRQAKYICI